MKEKLSDINQECYFNAKELSRRVIYLTKDFVELPDHPLRTFQDMMSLGLPV